MVNADDILAVVTTTVEENLDVEALFEAVVEFVTAASLELLDDLSFDLDRQIW